MEKMYGETTFTNFTMDTTAELFESVFIESA